MRALIIVAVVVSTSGCAAWFKDMKHAEYSRGYASGFNDCERIAPMVLLEPSSVLKNIQLGYYNKTTTECSTPSCGRVGEGPELGQ